VAAPCADGSAMFFNPAGLASLKGGHATAGVTLIGVEGGFTDDIFQQKASLDDPLLAVPQAYVSYSPSPRLGVGVGLFAPYGLQTEWPLTFDGRFAGYKNILRSVYVQPTLAYSGTAVFGQVPTNLIIPADIVIGGVTVAPAGTSVDALLRALGVFNTILVPQSVSTSITNPEQVVLGAAYEPRRDWTLLADYQFTRWAKRFSQINIDFANPLLNRVLYERYQNTNGFRFGVEWAKDATWTFRGG